MGVRFNVIHLIYKNKQTEGHFKDYQFSAETMHMHWQTGLHDMHETLNYPECLSMPDQGENFVTFDVHTHKRSSSKSVSAHDKVSTAQESMPAKKVATKGASKVAPPPPAQYIEKTVVETAPKTATKAVVKEATEEATKAVTKPVTKAATKAATKVATKK
jgi:NTE family protein